MALGEARVGGEETVAHFVGGELVPYRMQNYGQEKDQRASSPDPVSSYTPQPVVEQTLPLSSSRFSLHGPLPEE